MLDEERNHFVNGALQQGYPQETANQVYDYIELLLIMALTARMHLPIPLLVFKWLT